VEEPLDRELRERVFALLRPERVLYEDGALIAIDKPAGVPTQEARAGDEDDLPSRLRRFLELRDGVPGEAGPAPYVGAHQRLDAETSGVVVYTRSREANTPLAAQMEGRTVAKEYVAAVERWQRDGEATLRDRIAVDDGRAVITDARDPLGKDAVSRARVIARGTGGRALLSVRIETGRTHQIRAQLAHAGAPIAGDRAYGGAPAGRLMLHASRIALTHPVDRRAIEIVAPTPRALSSWVEGSGDDHRLALPDAIELAVERRFALGRAALREAAPTTAFRLLNDAGDGAPGIAVDVYADWLVLHLYGEVAGEPSVSGAEQEEHEVADALFALGFAGIYVKRRPRQSNTLDDGERSERAPEQPIRGRPAPAELVVRESGLPFAVRLGDGMSTGLFLDQRENRARVRSIAGGARVLNLFSYTCGFSVAAAAGGAISTVSVDASGAALDRGRMNLELSGAMDRAAHRTVRADVFEWLERAAKRGDQFDLICCDPPTYSSTKRIRWTSGREWRRLAAMCMAVLAPGGTLLATSNDRRMGRGTLRKWLREGATDAGAELAALRDLPAPRDFPPPVGSEPHTKGALAIRK
jgi:23S rRNA (cytosine1962-C5)-methyltransferase